MRRVTQALVSRLLAIPTTRGPDFVIGGADAPYLRRWFLIPRNRVFNVYLHHFMRSDDDRALHDHPWPFNLSWQLTGGYIEHTFRGPKMLRSGRCKLRLGRAPHRVELIDGNPVWTLFITGPRLWQWGFYCPQGWRHWKVFTNTADGGATVGKGCD